MVERVSKLPIPRGEIERLPCTVLLDDGPLGVYHRIKWEGIDHPWEIVHNNLQGKVLWQMAEELKTFRDGVERLREALKGHRDDPQSGLPELDAAYEHLKDIATRSHHHG